MLLRDLMSNEPCHPPNTFLSGLPTGSWGAMALSFSPDGSLLAVGCGDDLNYPLRIFDVEVPGKPREIVSLQWHGSVIYQLSWSPDSQWLASASGDGTACVWWIPHGSQNNNSKGRAAAAIPLRPYSVCRHTPTSYVYCCAFHPLAPYLLVTGAFDRGLRLWDTRIGREFKDEGSGANANEAGSHGSNDSSGGSVVSCFADPAIIASLSGLAPLPPAASTSSSSQAVPGTPSSGTASSNNNSNSGVPGTPGRRPGGNNTDDQRGAASSTPGPTPAISSAASSSSSSSSSSSLAFGCDALLLGFLNGGDPAEISAVTVMTALANNTNAASAATGLAMTGTTPTPGRSVRLLPPIAGTPATPLMSTVGGRRFGNTSTAFEGGGGGGTGGSGLGVHAGYVNALAFEEPSTTTTTKLQGSNSNRRPGAGAAAISSVRLATADSTGAIYIWQASCPPHNPAEAEDPIRGFNLLKELRPAVMRGMPVVSVKFRPAPNPSLPSPNQLLVLAQGQNASVGGSSAAGAATSVGILRTFDLTTYGALRGFQHVSCGSSRIDAVFSPDGRYIACGSESGVLHLWDAENGAIIPSKARVEGGRKAVIGYPRVMHGVSWSPNRHLLATSSFGAAAPVMLVGSVLAAGPSSPSGAGSGAAGSSGGGGAAGKR